ncbi:MAG: class I adenylate-forming enzyme family protein [Xanthobacteraceae bacterium]
MTLISDPPVVHPFMGRDAAFLLDARARQRGDHPMLIWSPFSDEGETWSYAKFAHDVARIAGGLAARGIKPGDRVLVHFENCPETLLARFACWWLGATSVLSNAHWMGPEIAPVVASLGIRAAITQPKFAARIAEHCPALEWIAISATDAGETPEAGTLPAKSQAFSALYGDPLPRRAPDPMAPAVILFTTGSTSRPKAVLWTHANLLWGGKVGALQQGLRAEDIYQVNMPVFHVVGFTWSLMPAFYTGATVVLQPRFSATRFWPAALAHRATIGSHAATEGFLRELPVPEHHFRQWLFGRHDPDRDTYFRLRGVAGWGMTEMVIPAVASDDSLDQRLHSVGRPYPGYNVRVENDAGELVKPGETGQLLIGAVRGLAIFQEYVDNPKAMAEAFDARDFFRTGDLVTLHEDGWITYRDRIKDVMKVGGESVSASEVEAVLNSVPGVREAAAVSRPDKHYGEVVVAFVVLADDAQVRQNDIVAAIASACQSSLAKFKNPRDIRVVAELPKIGNNKVHRPALRELARTDEPAAKIA